MTGVNRKMEYPMGVKKSGKQQIHRFMQDFQKVFDECKGRCHFVIDKEGTFCGEIVRERGHVISRTSVLDKLKDEKSGKVLEMEWHVAEWRRLFLASDDEHPVDLADPATFELRRVGTRDACTRRFACKPDDDKFKLLDDFEFPNFDDPTVRLMAVHRTVLGGLDLRRQERTLLQAWHSPVMRGSSRHQKAEWLKQIEGNRSGLRKALEAVQFFGKAWYTPQSSGAADPDLISVQVVSFRSRLKFAASMLSGAGAAVMVFPGGTDLHQMVLLYLTEEADRVRPDCERLVQVSNVSRKGDSYGVGVLDTMIRNGAGMVAASIASHDRLDEEDRLKINHAVYESLGICSLLHILPPTSGGNRRRVSE